jgi:hypothetical protein
MWLAVSAPLQAQETRPARLALKIPEASAAEVAGALSMVLGAPVAVEGAAARRAAVDVTAGTPLELLERVAATFGGSSMSVYTVQAGRTGETGSPAPSSGRTVSLSLQSVAPRTALSMVARAAGACLQAPGTLAGSVTLEGENLPVEEAMARVMEQIDASWHASYLLVVPESPSAPVETRVAPRVDVESMPPVSVSIAPRAGAPGEPAPRAPGVASLRTALTSGLAQLLQTDPDARGPAVERYAARLETLLTEVAPVGQPRPHLVPLRRFFRSGLRAFGGLTPDQQNEFRPVYDLLRRWMP